MEPQVADVGFQHSDWSTALAAQAALPRPAGATGPASPFQPVAAQQPRCLMILADEEKHLDYLQTQLKLVDLLGAELFLAQRVARTAR